MGDRHTTVIPLAEAAAVLQLPAAAVVALVESAYLTPEADGPDGPQFRLADLKAFVARNSGTEGSACDFDQSLGPFVAVDPKDLLVALDGRATEMAGRVFDIFATVFPEAQSWPATDQAQFIDQARARFEAILAVTGQGAEVDEALVGDLQEVGAQAAWSNSPLPQLLVILRISRDLVVQTAVEVAEVRGRHWGLALSLLMTRILPAMDRLTDALAQGYWSAIISRDEASREAKAGRDLEAVKNEFLAMVTADLRGPVAAIRGLGSKLQSQPGELSADQIGQIGDSVRRQAARIARWSDDLFDASRLDAGALQLSPRATNLAAVVEAALASVAGATGVEVAVPSDVVVLADPRRLEQVVANLVENAVEHGEPPVVVAVGSGPGPAVPTAVGEGSVVLTVTDSGHGVSEAVLPMLFSGTRMPGSLAQDQAGGTGLGLALVRGLAEAMGGRVWYRPAAGGGAVFGLSVPMPPGQA